MRELQSLSAIGTETNSASNKTRGKTLAWELRLGEPVSNSHVKQQIFVALTASSILAGVLGLLFYHRLHSIPFSTEVSSPKPPASGWGCSELRRALTPSEPSASINHQAVENTTPLSEDEVGIYKAVIQEWGARDVTSLNVSAMTSPLEANSTSTALIDCACATGIQLESLIRASRTYHKLTPEILRTERVRLVDPTKQAPIVRTNDPANALKRGRSLNDAVENAFAHGLFSLSEIAFDKEHKHALVSYSFVCGSLCGSGSTRIFEKTGSEWKRTTRSCGGWVS